MRYSPWVKAVVILLLISASAAFAAGIFDDGDKLVEPAKHTSGKGIIVLNYHFFNDRSVLERGLRAVGTVLLNLPLMSTKDAWAIGASSFEKQLKYLRDNGFKTISLDELVSFMRGAYHPAGRCVVITIDDGDRSVYEYAYPLLEKYGMKAAMFLITSKAGEKWDELEISSWDELREMDRSGTIEIESHTHDMHYKIEKGQSPHPVFDIVRESTDDEEIEAIAKDLKRSRFALRYYLEKDSKYLAWPYGFGSELSDSLAEMAGFKGILTLRAGPNRRGDPPTRIKRYAITPRTSFSEFRKIVEGSGG